MKKTPARIHNFLAWLLFAGCILQIYLIALYVFGAGSRDTHAFGGFLLSIVALLTLIVALVIRVNKWNVILSAVVFLLMFPVQGILAYAEVDGAIRALHGVIGMLIMSLSYLLANGFAKAVAPDSSGEGIRKTAKTVAAAD